MSGGATPPNLGSQNKERIMSKLFFAAALGLAGLPLGASAQGYQPDVHIGYADLDLSSPAGIARLDSRITAAASKVCENRPHVDAFWQNAVRKCRKAFTDQAEPQRLRALASAEPSRLVASTR